MAVNAVVLLLGASIVALTFNDVFQSVIVPRAVGRRFRPSSYVWRYLWKAWTSVAWRCYPRDDERREDLLATYAPFTLVLMLAVWVTMLVIGYGCVFWALRADFAPGLHTFGAALYFAGTTLLTIGFGDIVPRGPYARVVAVLTGASGLGVVSVTTAYLFAIFAAFQTREQFVVKTGARAGSPPSGVGLLAIASYAQVPGELNALMNEAQGWAATIMETHLAYPVLAYFRSSHDDISWIGTLGALLDAALLLMTTVEMPCGQARIFYGIGGHAARDLASYFRVEVAECQVGIERAEFDRALDRLERAGYTLANRDVAWARFAELRATYASELSGLALRFEIPPMQWVGDRNMVSPHVAERTSA